MKKLVVVLMLIGIALPVLANDALVLPQGVMRIYTVPVYGFQSGGWDDDGDFQDAEKNPNNPPIGSLFNLGGAIEYGITDQISLGAQWAPGFNLVGNLDGEDTTYSNSPFPPAAFTDENASAIFTLDSNGEVESADPLVGEDGTIEGATPIRIGSEIQVLGNQGWVSNETFRIQVGLGAEIGGWQRDWKEEGKSAADGNEYVDPLAYISGVDPRYALGGSLSVDYVITEELYVNVFGEFKQKLGRSYDVTDFYSEAGLVADASAVGIPNSGFLYFEGDQVENLEVDVAPSSTFETELEVTYQKQVSDLLRLGGSLPLTVTFDSAVEADVKAQLDSTEYNTATGGAFPTAIDEEISGYELDKSGYSMYLTPTVDFFLTGMTPPTQFLIKYGIPIAGQNASAVHTFVLEGRVYLAF
ncbi:MAG: hypothetical protein GVY23_09750 [Spirochaetes bacterium]|jgi:hypothetical protein|nr:hypothetical protein [Spirochaetota bacterium]